MRTLLCATILFWALSNQMEGVTAAPQSPPGSDEVQFFLTALAQDGAPVVLQETDLSAVVDKKETQVKRVRSAKDDPLLFAVLVDISKSGAPRSNSIKEAAFQLFQGLASAQKQGYLVVFNQRVAMSQVPLSALEAKQALDLVTFDGGTAVYDAIEQTCRQRLSRLRNPARPRRVIVVISDGGDNSSNVTHLKAEEAALEEGVSVFSVVMKGGGPRDVKILEEISQKTGGLATDVDLKQAVRASLAAIDAQWSVTVIPARSADHKLHSVELKCAQKAVHISAPEKLFLQ